MILLLDTNRLSEKRRKCVPEGVVVGQLMTPTSHRRNWAREDGLPWGIDNAAFAGFRREDFERMLRKEGASSEGCAFAVAPDVVGSARRTLEVFRWWRDRIAGLGLPVALASQDGIADLDVPWDDVGIG